MTATYPTPDQRQGEQSKYVHVYRSLPDYRMGEIRMRDAMSDLRRMYEAGSRSYLDIGCGRGEMLDKARALGFTVAHGTEIVPELCNDNVRLVAIHELGEIGARSYDAVTSFDVIEHVLSGDDLRLIENMGRIGRHQVALTANNKPSVDPTTGNDLHINKREYDAWDAIIRGILEPDWTVERMTDKEYVSETWFAHR